jgi:2-dehydro-3-deoxyphosphogluconate aldolase/(4S)-4-hydroxy-2-oxoglutarate aldolase
MDNSTKVYTAIKADGLLPLFYNDSAEVCIALSKALYAAGVQSIEFTNRGDFALENFKAMVAARNAEMPGLLLGVGTISTADEAKQFVAAGADFLISPFFDESVSNAAKAAGVPWIPGAMTPREVHLAKQAGCVMIKLFPGNVLGPGYVEAILPLFRGVDFIVTGGVDTEAENLAKWFKSGIVGVGMGSKLITKDILISKEYDKLTEITKALISTVKNNR